MLRPLTLIEIISDLLFLPVQVICWPLEYSLGAMFMAIVHDIDRIFP